MERAEQILVVPRAQLLPQPFHGFSVLRVDEYVARVRVHGVFRRRGEMEHDPSMKQVIPYLIVRSQDRIFLFRRSLAGSEARLHGKYSVGVGGHINQRDVRGATDLVAAGLRRELEEELVVTGAWRARLVGVLNDDSNAVGQVHFGLVHVVDVDSTGIAVRESEALSGRLAGTDEVRRLHDQMETWSQLILDAVDPLQL